VTAPLTPANFFSAIFLSSLKLMEIL